jgi:hypothetical protein
MTPTLSQSSLAEIKMKEYFLMGIAKTLAHRKE